jgi:hypothetical protein
MAEKEGSREREEGEGGRERTTLTLTLMQEIKAKKIDVLFDWVFFTIGRDLHI